MLVNRGLCSMAMDLWLYAIMLRKLVLEIGRLSISDDDLALSRLRLN